MRKIFSGFVLFIGILLGTAVTGYSQTAIVASPNPIPLSICNGDTILFVADNTSGTLVSFQWNFNGAAAGPQTLFGQNVTFVAGTPGTYTFALVVGNGTALDTFNFNMIVNACTPPTIAISGTPTTVCEGTQVQFTDASTPGSVPILSRLWTFNGGATPPTSGSTTPLIMYPTAGTYDVIYEVTDANGTYRDTLIAYINVVACPDPIANFIANVTQICPGECINFLDQSQNVVPGQSTWNWSFPGSDSAGSILQNPTNICYPIPGQYDVTLTVTNANGTDDVTKVGYIVVDSCLPPILSFDVESRKICQGTCIQFFNTSVNDTGIAWQFFGADPQYEFSNLDDPIVCYSDIGSFNFQIVVTNEYGADIYLTPDTSARISVMPFPKVVAPPDTSVLIGKGVILQAYGDGDGFYWTPEEGVFCQFCAKTVVRPIENTKYYVTNINENGCKSVDSVNVIVIDNYYRGVPDIFSPNGDGANDVLYVYGNGFKQMELYIYDRSGNIVFESRARADGWDGTYKGEMMEAGVYAYFVKITYLSGFQEILKGDITLVR